MNTIKRIHIFVALFAVVAVSGGAVYFIGDGSILPAQIAPQEATLTDETEEPPPSGCGNGIVEEGEDCDDGNTFDDDGCSGNCTSEWTEPPTPEAACGNGIVEEGEDCDDGNTFDDDGCSGNCTSEEFGEAFCGDGIKQADEECEVDDDCSNSKLCNGWDCTCSITPNECGNGRIDEGEECEASGFEDEEEYYCNDGKVCDYSECKCIKEGECGNGQVEGGEECESDAQCPFTSCNEDTCECDPPGAPEEPSTPGM